MSVSVAKWTVLFSLCASRINFLCSLLWSIAMLATFRASPTPCPLLLHPVFSSLGAWERTCAQDCNDSANCILCLRCDLHDLLKESFPNTFFADSRASTMQACTDFLDFVGFGIGSPVPVRALRPLQLAGHSGFHWNFQFLLAF